MKRVCAECGTDLDEVQELRLWSRLWVVVVLATVVFLLSLVAYAYFSPNGQQSCRSLCGDGRVASWTDSHRDRENFPQPGKCTCSEPK